MTKTRYALMYTDRETGLSFVLEVEEPTRADAVLQGRRWLRAQGDPAIDPNAYELSAVVAAPA